jgi:hypothetical protein
MDFGKAFAFVFEDDEWIKKILLAGLISLIPVVGQLFLMGWGLEISRRVITKEFTLLPDIDFGDYIGKGFKLFVVSLVYSVPAIILSILISIVSAVFYETDIQFIGFLFIALFGLLLLVYSVLLIVIIPAAMANLAAKGSIGDALRLGEVFGLLKKAPGAFLMVVLGELIAGAIAPLGGIAFGIGAFLTATYALTLVSHLIGQAYLQAQK